MSKGPFGLDSLREDVDNKVDKVAGKGLSTHDLTDEVLEDINNKVDKEAGKGLSTHDYDNTAKGKVDDMGTAASRDVMVSPVDKATPNALMPRGAFGWGEEVTYRSLELVTSLVICLPIIWSLTHHQWFYSLKLSRTASWRAG